MKYNQSNGVTNSPAIPAISIMFFVYNLVQTRPVMADDMAVEYLEKLQHIQDSYDHEFYVELWMSALTGLAECDKATTGVAGRAHTLLWKSFVLVKLPSLIEKLELKKFNKFKNGEENKYNCHEYVINQLFGFKGLINACNQLVDDDIFHAADITVDILRVCLSRKLVRKEFVNRLLELEYGEIDGEDSVGLTAENILDDPSKPIIDHLVSTATTSFLHQESRIETILKLMSEWSVKSEILPLATLCQSLEIPILLDIIYLYRHPSEFISPLERLCNTWTSKAETKESLIQDYENYGTIFIFLINTIDRYEFHKNLKDVLRDEGGFCHKWLIRSGSAYDTNSLDHNKQIVENWISLLLDSADSSQEIPENLIRESNPRNLIELSPTIFKEALLKIGTGIDDDITAVAASFEKLLSGFTYFLKPHMSYALIGVCQWLCDDILFKGKSTISTKVLNRLISEDTFPDSIIKLIGNKLLLLFDIMSENGSVEDTVIHLKIATSMLAPTWTITKHPAEKLYFRFKIMFKSIIYGGRQKPSLIYEIFLSENYFNNDINTSLSTEYESGGLGGGITNNLFDEFIANPSSWLGPHHLDIELFRNCLEINGPRIFVDLIVEEVLSAGKKGMGIRAAELGASLLTLPIYYTWNEYLHPTTLIKIFFTDYLPLILEKKIEMYTQSYALGIMTLFILMMIKKDIHVGGVGVSIDSIGDIDIGIGNSVGDGTNDIIMIDAIINASTEEKGGGTEEKGETKVGIDDFIKFVLPIFKQENDSKIIQNGNKKIDHSVKKEEDENVLKLINGPVKGFIDGLLMHEDIKIIIPELESLVK